MRNGLIVFILAFVMSAAAAAPTQFFVDGSTSPSSTLGSPTKQVR